LGYKIINKLSVGGLIRYVNTSTFLDQISMGKGDGFAADVGVFYRHNASLSAGLVMKPLIASYITYDNGSNAKLESQKLRFGVAYRPWRQLLVASDIGERLHLGTEYTYADLLSLRMGVQRDLEGTERETLVSFGTGLKVGPMRFDYSYTDYPHLQSTNRFSLSASFNLGYKPIVVKAPESYELFPSLRHTYGSSPFLQFDVENRTDEPLPFNWAVSLGEFMDAPAKGDTTVRPKEHVQIAVTGSMSQEFVTNPSDKLEKGTITLTYRKGRQEKEEITDYQVYVYSRGTIDWNQDRSWVAAFVDPRDPDIGAFSASLAAGWSQYGESRQYSSNISKAMLVYNGLKAYGLQYLPDPNTPFSRAAQTQGAVDNVKYPAELLSRGTGDCDDLTVLFCSLLESIGIRTAILDVPGHLYMMFDTDVSSAHRVALGLPDSMMVDYKGSLFVPLEVTQVGTEDFLSAWKEGAREYYRGPSAGDAGIIDLQEAWFTYPAVSVGIKPDLKPVDRALADASTESDWAALSKLSDDYVQARYYAAIESYRSSGSLLNELGVAALLDGDLAKAGQLFEQALQKEPGHRDAQTNLANLTALRGDVRQAEAMYLSITDTTYLRNKAIPNLIVARILATDAENPKDVSELKDWLDDMENRHLLGADHFERKQQIRMCLESSPGDVSTWSRCVRGALSGEQEHLNAPTKGALPSSSAEERVHLFEWYY